MIKIASATFTAMVGNGIGMRGGGGVLGTHTFFDKLLQKSTPLCPEDICTSQTAIPTDDTQIGDPMLHQVVGSLQAALPCGESFAAGTANDCATLQTSKIRKEAKATNKNRQK